MIIRRGLLKIIIISVISLSIVSTWYINTFLAPVKLKGFLTKSISETINRPAAIEKVRFSVFRGFVLDNLVLYEPDGKTEFIKIERINTTLLFIPLLREKKIVIPSVNIYGPSVNIVKNQDNSWNFLATPMLKKEPVSGHKKTGDFSLLVQHINISNGSIGFTDKVKVPAYRRQLINLDGDISVSLKGILRFKMISYLDTPEKTNIALDGSYAPREGRLSLKTAIRNLSLLEPYAYFNQLALFVLLKNGSADAVVDIKMDKTQKISLGITSAVKNMDIAFFGLGIRGDTDINGTIEIPPSKPSGMNYKMNIGLKGPTLSGVYALGEVSGLNGTIEIGNDGISTTGLEGLVKNNPIKLSGGLKNLSDPQLRLLMQSNIDLAACKDLLPEDLKEKLKGIDVNGPADINLKIYKRFKDPVPPLLEGNIKLSGANLSVSGLAKKFEKISGEVSFKNEVLYLSRLTFGYGPKNYILDAKINGIDSPDVKMKLKGGDLSLDARFRTEGKNVRIPRAAGKYFNSHFQFTGNISDIDNPAIITRGNLEVDLLDLPKILPDKAPALTGLGLKGLCNFEFYFNGPLKDPKNLEAIIKGQSGAINIWGLKIDEVKLDLRMKDGALQIPEFSAKPYGGGLAASMGMDLNQPNPPYQINLLVQDVDLSKLILDTPAKDKPIKGRAMAKVDLRGYGKNAETIKGEGRIFVKGGYLWEVPLLRGLIDLLLLPKVSTMVFDEASANFIITNKIISTADLTLYSKNVNLLGQGNIGFDGNLDFLVTTTIAEDFLKDSSDLSRLTSILLSEAGQLIGNVKITGTLKNPEYKFIPLPLDKVLKDKLKVILGGFF